MGNLLLAEIWLLLQMEIPLYVQFLIEFLFSIWSSNHTFFVLNFSSLFISCFSHKSFTMIPENRRNIKASAMSPNGSTYVSVDDEGRALILNFHKRVSIGHFNFKGKVNCLSFSPNGKYLAVGVGKILCVYYAPSLLREFIILNMHRKFTGAYDDIITIAWSSDSEFVAFGGRDLAIRIYSLNALEGYDVKVLMGHKRVIRGLCFGNDEDVNCFSLDYFYL